MNRRNLLAGVLALPLFRWLKPLAAAELADKPEQRGPSHGVCAGCRQTFRRNIYDYAIKTWLLTSGKPPSPANLLIERWCGHCHSEPSVKPGFLVVTRMWPRLRLDNLALFDFGWCNEDEVTHCMIEVGIDFVGPWHPPFDVAKSTET